MDMSTMHSKYPSNNYILALRLYLFHASFVCSMVVYLMRCIFMGNVYVYTTMVSQLYIAYVSCPNYVPVNSCGKVQAIDPW